MIRNIDHVFPLEPFGGGPGFRGYGLREPGLQQWLDPFLSVDHFYMSEPTFPPHPHAGFSAVTYLFDDSETGFVNRDSLGHHLDIAPGAVHWTQAAAGVMHEEVPHHRGRVAHGLQIFVNLPAALKREPPSVFHADPPQMPFVQLGEAAARVVFGRWVGVASSLVPGSEATLLDVTLQDASALTLDLAPNRRVFVMVIEGLLAGSTVQGLVTLGPAQGAAYAPARISGRTTLRAVSGEARCAVFSGVPIDEPVVFGGPFVMNTAEEIVQARNDFAAGRMGWLAPSH
jgi:redox-sensitive bicupin YhaK (pirin superfamily)